MPSCAPSVTRSVSPFRDGKYDPDTAAAYFQSRRLAAKRTFGQLSRQWNLWHALYGLKKRGTRKQANCSGPVSTHSHGSMPPSSSMSSMSLAQARSNFTPRPKTPPLEDRAESNRAMSTFLRCDLVEPNPDCCWSCRHLQVCSRRTCAGAGG